MAAVLLMVMASVSWALDLEGDAVQGGLMYGRTEASAVVTVEGRPVRVADDGRFVFGFGRDHGDEAVVEVRAPDGTIERRTIAVAQRDYDIQRIDGLPRDKVVFNAEQLTRIRADQTAVRAARAHDTPALDFTAGFEWPAQGPISGVYGSARILNGEPRRPHFGVDVAAPKGAPVVAAAGGIVRLADDLYLTGLTIVLDHGHGLTTSYLHLSEIQVAVGERVEKGQAIGKVGASGRATGAHLDWRLNWHDVRLDAALVVGPMPPAE